MFSLFLIGQIRQSEAQVGSGLIEWTPLSSTAPSVIKIDPKRRWVAQLEHGWIGWLKVFRLKEDLTIGKEVLNTQNSKGFFVMDIEWVGSRLAMMVVEGYDTFGEWDKKRDRVTGMRREVPWQVKLAIFEPQTRQMIELGENRDLLDTKLFAHPSGDMVLIVEPRGRGALTPRRTKIAALLPVPFAKVEVKVELSFPVEKVGRFFLPDRWLPDGQRF